MAIHSQSVWQVKGLSLQTVQELKDGQKRYFFLKKKRNAILDVNLSAILRNESLHIDDDWQNNLKRKITDFRTDCVANTQTVTRTASQVKLGCQWMTASSEELLTKEKVDSSSKTCIQRRSKIGSQTVQAEISLLYSLIDCSPKKKREMLIKKNPLTVKNDSTAWVAWSLFSVQMRVLRFGVN